MMITKHKFIYIMIMSKKTLFSLLLLAVLLISPALASAATTSTSSLPGLVESVEQAMDTDKIEHAQIRLDLGMSRRISQSPAGLADLKLAPEQVLNRDLLTIYAQKLALSEPIKELYLGEDAVEVTVRGDARLLRLIPVGLAYHVSVTLDGRTSDITVDHPAGWSWLAAKLSPETVATRIKNDLDEAQYISGTQQKAFLLQFIMDSVHF